jgi:Uma2 family endonuclease
MTECYCFIAAIWRWIVLISHMNQMFPPRSVVRTTQAAEGVPRWRWTTDELVRLTELGVFTEYDRFELLGGEIVPMSGSGQRHDALTDGLAQFVMPQLQRRLRIGQERHLHLDEATYTVPDLIVRPALIKMPDVRGDTVLWIAEISDASLSYDLTIKAPLYARFGVREYWVVEAWSLITHVHRGPTAAGYSTVTEVAADVELAPLLVPELKVTMAKLDI